MLYRLHRRDRVAAPEPRGRGPRLARAGRGAGARAGACRPQGRRLGGGAPARCCRAPSSAPSRPASARAARPAISAGNASVASVAASLADVALGGLAGRAALVVGAGRTSELAALNLMSRGLRRLSVANRTYQQRLRPRRAARRIGGALRGRRRAASSGRRGRQLDLGTARGAAQPTWSRPRSPAARRPLLRARPRRSARTSSPRSRSSRAVACTASTISRPRSRATWPCAATRPRPPRRSAPTPPRSSAPGRPSARWCPRSAGCARAPRRCARPRSERRSAGLDPAERDRLERLSRGLVGKLLHEPDDPAARERGGVGRRAVRGDRARPVRSRRRPRVARCSVSGRAGRGSRSARPGSPRTRCARRGSARWRSCRSRRSATATGGTASPSSAGAGSSAPSSRRPFAAS